jgi:uncharacterized protein
MRTDVAAAVAQAPIVDGRAAARNAMRHARPLPLLALAARATVDVVGALFGAAPKLVPVAGGPGEVALLTTPDAAHGRAALDPEGVYPEWDGRVAARFAFSSSRYRPVKRARRVQCPLLILAYNDDQSALVRPAARAAELAPRGELALRPGGHYASFTTDFADTLRVQLDFLHTHLFDADAT